MPPAQSQPQKPLPLFERVELAVQQLYTQVGQLVLAVKRLEDRLSAIEEAVRGQRFERVRPDEPAMHPWEAPWNQLSDDGDEGAVDGPWEELKALLGPVPYEEDGS